VTRRWPAVLALVVSLPVVPAGPAAATPDADCTQQSRRVRLPDGFVEARLSFSALLDNGRARVGDTFTLGEVRELRVIVNWSQAEDAHAYGADLYAPDGTLYQRFSTAFTGERRPVAVVTRVPVAGSTIADSSLLGEWCAEAFLDDEDAPIARRRFDLLAP